MVDHNQLPDYIRNKQGGAPSLAHKAIGVVGAGAGPYLSIMGDRFTFVDIAGNEQPVQTLYVDVVIVDANEHMSKMYYSTKYDPNNPTPPTCFSDNGVAPSIAAGEPQSATCASCRWNVWGSKISEMGSKVKACRDEHKLAIIVPGMPNSMFRLTVPPNSLTNWRAYVAKFLNAGFDMSDVVTRLSFEGGGERGTLTFAPSPTPWLDAATLAVRDQAVKTRASDMIVGRLDRPRQAAIAPPAGQQVGHFQQHDSNSGMPGPTPFPAATAAPSAATSSVAPPAQHWGAPTPQAAPTTPGPTAAPTASPSNPPVRRRRRTKQEMEQANAQQQPAAAAPPAAPAMAPFRPVTNSGPTFGIQEAPPPNAELQANIESIFGR
jgi:hypothetical protein